MRYRFFISCIFVAPAIGAQGSGATQPPADALQRANALFTQSNWSASLDAYSALAKEYPAHALSRFRVGVSLLGLGKLSDAEVNLREGERLGIPAAQAGFRLAQVFAEGHRATPPSSFNIFDRSIAQWRQTWVDNVGGQHDYWGGIKDGNMAFIGDTPAANGQFGRVPTRLTFFHISKDSVRQLSEISSDSGKTWTANYDLMYVRRKP